MAQVYNNPNIAEYKTVAPDEFEKVIENPDVFLLDVRNAEEFASGHIKGATNIDVQDLGFLPEATRVLPKDKTIAVYCRSGKRSAEASEILSNAGYKIVNLDGGITNWEADGKPVTAQ